MGFTCNPGPTPATLPTLFNPTQELASSNLPRVAGHVGANLANGLDMPGFSSTRFDDLWPQDQSKSLAHPRSWLRQVPTTAGRKPTPPPGSPALVKDLSRVMKVLCSSIPPSVNANPSMRESYFTFIMDQYEVRRIRKFFRPPPTHLRSALVSRIRNSGHILWFMYLGARIFQALSETRDHSAIQPYVYWMDKFDRQATNSPVRNPSVDELGNRLAGLLE
ncbi:hypothetical protein FS749_007571, partial [Ceratobasidium sp. UAMH 11750]